jgi:hypothetical protein
MPSSRHTPTGPERPGSAGQPGQAEPPAFPLRDPDGSIRTRFGAPADDVSAGAAVLRARASANGVALIETTAVDLAAAVVATDAWQWVTGAADLRRPATHGPGAVAVLAAALARAAGHRHYVTGAVLDDVTADIDADAVALIDAYRLWIREQLGSEQEEPVLRRAAADLAAGHHAARAGRELGLAGLAALVDALSVSPDPA